MWFYFLFGIHLIFMYNVNKKNRPGSYCFTQRFINRKIMQYSISKYLCRISYVEYIIIYYVIQCLKQYNDCLNHRQEWLLVKKDWFSIFYVSLIVILLYFSNCHTRITTDTKKKLSPTCRQNIIFIIIVAASLILPWDTWWTVLRYFYHFVPE